MKILRIIIERNEKNIIGDAFDHLSKYLGNYCKDGKHTYFFAGDINIDISSDSDFSNDYLNILEDNGEVEERADSCDVIEENNLVIMKTDKSNITAPASKKTEKSSRKSKSKSKSFPRKNHCSEKTSRLVNDPSNLVNNKSDKKKSLSCLTINVQSIRHESDELYAFLESVEFPDIVILIEHWLSKEEPVFIRNYLLVSHSCRSDYRCGGTRILSNVMAMEELEFTPFKKHNDLITEKQFGFSMASSATAHLYVCLVQMESKL
ncbi:hypothetical protein JTB14_004256 [Gonioctena quinquepunctata]|nr:hypothetical protein JTB14_004256 [Gonioctena quinquepunctata]